MTQQASRQITIILPADAAGERLDKYLSTVAELDISRSRLQQLIADNMVLISGRPVDKKYKIRGGENVIITIPPPDRPDISPQDIPLEIVYDDPYLAVVNKPAGLVTHPAPGNLTHTLVNALVYHFNLTPNTPDDFRPGVIHRLDKLTSGVLIVAKDEKTGNRLRNMMAERRITKKYTGVICGRMPDDQGTISLPVGRSLKDRKKMAVTNVNAREAITHYMVLETYRLAQLLDITLETGRTHQIRVHLSHLNRPVMGDGDYGGRLRWIRGIDPSLRTAAHSLLELIDRQALHAREVAFDHPVTGKFLEVRSELPDDMLGLITTLRERYAAS